DLPGGSLHDEPRFNRDDVLPCQAEIEQTVQRQGDFSFLARRQLNIYMPCSIYIRCTHFASFEAAFQVTRGWDDTAILRVDLQEEGVKWAIVETQQLVPKVLESQRERDWFARARFLRDGRGEQHHAVKGFLHGIDPPRRVSPGALLDRRG